jgi:predicted transglutaminase-like cysteine proteinase
MLRRGSARIMLCVSVLIGWTSSMAVAEHAGASMITGSITSQPIGHYEFCRQFSDECSIRSKRKNAPKVTAFGWEVVKKVNSLVNDHVAPLTDWELHGQEEVWSYPGVAGDCEDYVLLKRQMLIEKGFSASDLLITVVRRPDGEGHAVLTLRTSKGDFVLDNLANDVKIWTQTPYKYLKRQASFHTGRWVNIQNGNPVVVGSLR